MQEVYNLGQTLLRLVLSGDIGKGHAGLLLHIDLRIALRDAAHETAAAPADAHAPHEEVHRAENHNDRQKERRAREQHTHDVKALSRHDRACLIELFGKIPVAVHAGRHIVARVFLSRRLCIKAYDRIADFGADNDFLIDHAEKVAVADLLGLRTATSSAERTDKAEEQKDDRKQEQHGHQEASASAALSAPVIAAVSGAAALGQILVLVIRFKVTAAQPAEKQLRLCFLYFPFVFCHKNKTFRRALPKRQAAHFILLFYLV